MSSATLSHGLTNAAKQIALRVRDPGDGGEGALLQVETGAELGTAASSVASLADVTSTTSAAAFGPLAAGPNGIRVIAHPGNGSVVIRVSGSDVAANQGEPLTAGGWSDFAVSNASLLKHITESGTGVVCARAI